MGNAVTCDQANIQCKCIRLQDVLCFLYTEGEKNIYKRFFVQNKKMKKNMSKKKKSVSIMSNNFQTITKTNIMYKHDEQSYQKKEQKNRTITHNI